MSHLRLQIALGPRIAVVAFLLQLSCLVAGAQSPANGVPGAGSGAPARRVRLLLELTSAYQSNPWQLDSGVSPSRTDGANFSASAGFRSRRTQFQLAGYAGVARSAQFPELNRETEGGQLTVTRTLGARVQVAGTAGVRSALALDLAYGAPLSGTVAPGGSDGPAPIPGAPGSVPVTGGTDAGGAIPGAGALPIRTLRVRMDDAGLAIASRVSARTTLSASSQFARTVYNVAGSDPGRTLSGQAKLGRQLNARLLLDLQGDVSNTSGGYTGQPHANLQNLAVVSTLTVTRVVAQLGLGVTRVSSSETSTGTGALSTGIGTAAIGPSATASVSRRSDRGFLTVFGERRALPTFGREAFLFNNAVGVSAARTLTASAGISGSAQTARSQTTLGQRQRFASTSAELTYRQRIFYGVSLNTTAFLRQRQNNGTFQDTGVALTASVPLR